MMVPVCILCLKVIALSRGRVIRARRDKFKRRHEEENRADFIVRHQSLGKFLLLFSLIHLRVELNNKQEVANIFQFKKIKDSFHPLVYSAAASQ